MQSIAEEQNCFVATATSSEYTSESVSSTVNNWHPKRKECMISNLRHQHSHAMIGTEIKIKLNLEWLRSKYPFFKRAKKMIESANDLTFPLRFVKCTRQNLQHFLRTGSLQWSLVFVSEASKK
jgi:hypothetical protein